MRSTLRRFAAVKPARYLEAGSPTGLTGLYTHSSPRSTLLFLYSRTLEKLRPIPESSLYRQSVEALTRQRLAIVEAAEPPGHAEWAERTRELLREKNPSFRIRSDAAPSAGTPAAQVTADGRLFVHASNRPAQDTRYQEWDGERGAEDEEGAEGLRGEAERDADVRRINARNDLHGEDKVEWEPEPQLTADQIEEIEAKIGGGLIEEVVRTAENELKLVDIMADAKVWEDLVEKPVEGQWTYFERNSN
ncbi:ETC complex I subunit conserved region-domain-containing protein [Xylariaceae sp. FL0662B]|nr:ETC complex I subunit conserved region-domain-containing protein [Xylariaceae sp. FL0662B]